MAPTHHGPGLDDISKRDGAAHAEGGERCAADVGGCRQGRIAAAFAESMGVAMARRQSSKRLQLDIASLYLVGGFREQLPAVGTIAG